jgi:hypothetical protein
MPLVKRPILLALIFGIPWALVLLSWVRVGRFEFKPAYSGEDVGQFVNFTPSLSEQDPRCVWISKGEWGGVQKGDLLDIGFLGLASGSKSTVLGGYDWIHLRGGVEIGRGSSGKLRFGLLYGLACALPFILAGIDVLCARSRTSRSTTQGQSNPV